MPGKYTRGTRRLEVACEQCGEIFLVFLSKLAEGGGRFCSRLCQYAAAYTRVEAYCATCGKLFTAPRRRVLAGLARFCSPKCNGRQSARLRAVPMLDRLWARVDKHGPASAYRPDLGPCWIWTGNKVDGKGYGQITEVKKTFQVHRVAYEAMVGPIPPGLELDHLCRVVRCCRPDHLEPVTPAENQRRGFGFAAVNSRKTHCPQGHPFDEANTIVRAKGHRGCRLCNQAAWRKYNAKRKR